MLITLFQKGGTLMVPLLICSLISLTFIVERCFFWIRHHRERSLDDVEKTIELLQSNSIPIDEIKEQLSTQTDFICRLYKQALDNPENVKSALDLETTKELGRMRQYHSILDTIITLAPMIGILGTIVGIILSFEFLGSSQLQDPKLVTNGIAQALITTAAGLSIAILTLIPYNFFNSQVSRASKLMEIYLSKLEIVLSKLNTTKPSNTITISSSDSNNSLKTDPILEKP